MNILLVDDQKNVIDGLLKGINWANLGISNVYKAYNTSDAKVLFNNVSIDILLTDIEMPGENGLKLVEWVRNSKFHTKCIFLTSHADFQYAQYAIKMGSIDYILQPCPYQEIEKVIAVAIKKAEADAKLKSLHTYGNLIQNDYSMQELIFKNYITKTQNVSYLEPLIHSTQSDIESIKGYLSVFQIAPDSTDPLISDTALLSFSLHNILKEKMGLFKFQTMFCETEIYQYALFSFSDEGKNISPDSYCSQFNSLLELFHELLHVEITANLSSLLISLHDIHHEKEQLCAKLPSVIILSPPPTDLNPVDLVKKYIAQHIEENITRSVLADYVHLNSDYLARLFKAETEYTLNDYIVNEKMKRAQNLIRTTLLPIGLIASKVGYDNFSYFSKLYKKVIGVTPTDERNDIMT